MKERITKRRVDALKPGELLVDDEVQGFVARCLPSGSVVYSFRYRDRATGARRWLSLGRHGNITPDQARTLAKKRAGEVADYRDPQAERRRARQAAEAEARTVSVVLDEHVTRYVRKVGLRGADEVERIFTRYVKPRIGSISIYALRRSAIVKMLDEIEDEHGPVMADRTLAHLRKALTWYAARDDDFNSPIVRGMARTKPKERARQRVLSDEEIRDLWAALDTMSGPFPAIVRTLLLTAQRREEVAQMRESELAADVWTIPEERYKNGLVHVVPLSAAACAIIEAARKLPDGIKRRGPYIFSTTAGEKPFAGFSKARRELDAAIGRVREEAARGPMPHWTLHDLRRTARTLMTRAGVHPDVAERVLGHVIGGVRGVYDRHAYVDEKRDALAKLAALLDRILKPPAGNVVPLRVAAAPDARAESA